MLDPFGGGGSIPLEAQRLGCETYSCDLNPVAVLIQKCTLEYPQRYGERLYDDVKKQGEQIIAQVTEELEQFYPLELRAPAGQISQDAYEELLENLRTLGIVVEEV